MSWFTYDTAAHNMAMARSKKAGKPLAWGVRLFQGPGDPPECYLVHHWGTELVRVYPDRWVLFGGKRTITDKRTINTFSPVWIVTHQYEWYLRLCTIHGIWLPFREGLTVGSDGMLQIGLPPTLQGILCDEKAMRAGVLRDWLADNGMHRERAESIADALKKNPFGKGYNAAVAALLEATCK